MAILRAKTSSGSFNRFGVQSATIESFEDRAHKFDWADVYLVIEFAVEGSKYTRPCKVVGSFDKNPDGTIDGNSSLLRKITYMCDAIGFEGGVNQHGEWVDADESPINDIVAYLTDTYAGSKCTIYVFKERGKDGKAYTRVHNKILKEQTGSDADLQGFIDWVKKNGYHKEVDPSESNDSTPTQETVKAADGLDVASL